jgi:hypothetical protein
MPPFVRSHFYVFILKNKFCDNGPGSSVGIATGYGLDGPGDRIPMGAIFFTHVQTGPATHPASCTMGTGSFPAVKRPGCGTDHPPLLLPRLRMGRPISLSPFQGHEAYNRVKFTFHIL